MEAMGNEDEEDFLENTINTQRFYILYTYENIHEDKVIIFFITESSTLAFEKPGTRVCGIFSRI